MLEKKQVKTLIVLSLIWASVFILYSISIILRPSEVELLDLIDDGQDENLTSFNHYYTEFFVDQIHEQKELVVTMYPSPDGEWIGWGIKTSIDIPKGASLVVDYSMSTATQEVAMNILDASSNDISFFHHEYWYYLLPNPGLEGKEIYIDLKEMEYNTYQPFNQPRDGSIDLNGQIAFEFSIDPIFHEEVVEFRIRSLRFTWDYPKLPLLLSTLAWSLLILWTALSIPSMVKINRPLVEIKNQYVHLAALLLIIPGLNNLKFTTNAQSWFLLCLAGSVFFFILLTRITRGEYWLFSYLVYPPIILLMFKDLPVFNLILLLFIFYIPFIFRDTLWKIVPVFLFILVFMLYRISKETYHIMLSFLGFLPFIIDLVIRLLIQDSNIKDDYLRAQSLYKSILSNSNEIILITSKDGTIEGYNQGFRNWLPKFTLLESHSKLSEVLPENYEMAWFDPVNWANRTQRIRLEKNNRLFYYMIRCYPIIQIDNTKAYQWFITDITEQQVLQEQLDRVNKELLTLSQTDDLTGLANRRSFTSMIHGEWNRCGRKGLPLTIAIGDIDFFKQYNDYYGHLAGDETLIKVANLWNRAARRPYDMAARLGGEEFILVFPDAKPVDIIPLLERIMEDLKEADIIHSSNPEGSTLTMSMGLTWTVPEKNKSWESLFKECDHWLYQAKQEGRNRIILGKDGQLLDFYVPRLP